MNYDLSKISNSDVFWLESRLKTTHKNLCGFTFQEWHCLIVFKKLQNLKNALFIVNLIDKAIAFNLGNSLSSNVLNCMVLEKSH
jgi:hypothetical protein